MKTASYRVVDQFPEPAYSALSDEAFSDYKESGLLADVAREEQSARTSQQDTEDRDEFRVAAFRDDTLVGWTFAYPEGASLYMVNSGVALADRGQGIYSELVRMVIEHAKTRGYVSIQSRHAAANNAVIVAKLKLGFFVSGFEYSEVYGPLVRLTYLLGSLRRTLYKSRATPIRRPKPKNDA